MLNVTSVTVYYKCKHLVVEIIYILIYLIHANLPPRMMK